MHRVRSSFGEVRENSAFILDGVFSMKVKLPNGGYGALSVSGIRKSISDGAPVDAACGSLTDP